MTSPHEHDAPLGGAGAPGPAEGGDAPRFTDKRRIDPETGELRSTAPSGAGPVGAGSPGAADAAADADPLAALDFEPSSGTDAELAAAQAAATELLGDLQRLQAEYVNYRKRVDRDRSVARDQTVVQVLEALIPVLDDIGLARQHGELVGPFAAIADKLEASLGKFGVERYGEAGEPFDPNVHEALMHQHSPDVDGPTVGTVLQDGYRVGDRVVRAARVAVVDPDA